MRLLIEEINKYNGQWLDRSIVTWWFLRERDQEENTQIFNKFPMVPKISMKIPAIIIIRWAIWSIESILEIEKKWICLDLRKFIRITRLQILDKIIYTWERFSGKMSSHRKSTCFSSVSRWCSWYIISINDLPSYEGQDLLSFDILITFSSLIKGSYNYHYRRIYFPLLRV